MLAVALAMLPNYTFAQEPFDCAVYYTQHDNSGNLISQGCETYAEFPPSALKKDRLRNIGVLGPAGRMRTPYVLELLQDADWDVRVEAARTLGLLGEYSAIPQLIVAIDARDWKLTYEAMISLKKLKAPEAAGVLDNIARTYWHPAIAKAADDLLRGTTAPTQSWSILDDDVIRRYCEARIDQAQLPRCSPRDTQDRARFNWERQEYEQRFVDSFTNTPILKDAQSLGHSLKTSEGESTASITGSSAASFTLPRETHGRLFSGRISLPWQSRETALSWWPASTTCWRIEATFLNSSAAPTACGERRDSGACPEHLLMS